MNEMMHSPGLSVTLMVVLVLALGGILIAAQVVGRKAFNEDHER
jgi:hypothetical protein